jgi:hypothetical protein
VYDLRGSKRTAKRKCWIVFGASCGDGKSKDRALWPLAYALRSLGDLETRRTAARLGPVAQLSRLRAGRR